MKKERDIYCWTQTGIRGDRSCPELSGHIHCRNCPRYQAGGRDLLGREPPKDYLENWAKTIARPETKKDGSQKTIMVFRIGSEWLALPAGLFVETTRPRPIRRVPHRSNSVFLGLASIWGNIHLCFSADALLGIQPAPDAKAKDKAPRWFCVVSRHNLPWVFPADEVYGLGNYIEKNVQPVPVNVAKTTLKFTTGIVAVNRRQTGLIDEELFFAALERSIA
ncbi:MAG: chemotaxis protein CheW [Kiritimatiellae bacterium]|nr:chemotaxis protein CheW [Kiritimatiellia bacterium]